eukprot:1553421-Pleurochrysis_carterae.AAC.1
MRSKWSTNGLSSGWNASHEAPGLVVCSCSCRYSSRPRSPSGGARGAGSASRFDGLMAPLMLTTDLPIVSSMCSRTLPRRSARAQPSHENRRSTSMYGFGKTCSKRAAVCLAAAGADGCAHAGLPLAVLRACLRAELERIVLVDLLQVAVLMLAGSTKGMKKP